MHCNNEHSSRHFLQLLLKGSACNVMDLPKCICLHNHFTPDCFVNEGQYKAGCAKTLFLKDGLVALPPEEVSIRFFNESFANCLSK